MIGQNRTWIDIDLDALVTNYRTACSMTKALVTCVVKSNAYGHGAVRVAQALSEAGCNSFAVSCPREAVELRSAGIEGEILVMGLTETEDMGILVRHAVTMTAASEAELLCMEKAAEAEDAIALVHLKADTGFHRLGFPCGRESAASLARLCVSLPHVRVVGLYSHLGLISRERDEAQYASLMAVRRALEENGLSISDVHLCDSIGLVRYPQWHLSRCRVGAFLYGVRPSRSEHMPFSCSETLALRTRVAQVRDVPAGDVIGYDESGVTQRPVRVATLSAGYGDGYPRCLSSGRGKAMIHGHLAPVIGLVCMDQMMVDVTDIPECAPGDTATLLGGGISYGEYADWANTNRNECITILSRRPLRVYRQGGRIVTVVDSMLNLREDMAL